MAYVIFAAVFTIYILSNYKESKNQLHMAQLEGYKPSQYYSWIKNNFKPLFVNESIIFLVSGFLILTFNYIKNPLIAEILGLILYTVVIIFSLYLLKKNSKKPKKPLVMTSRAKRLMTINFILLSLYGIFLLLFSNIIVSISCFCLIRFLLPLNMLLSVIIAYPIEMAVQHWYFHDAQKKIRSMKNLKVIGITGSFGKTSTKYFTKTILSEKYNTLMTPESYNTPMGITRVIREQLNESHEVFVCEMGARYPHDIKTLCDLAGPDVGILTSIGKQHLETFKTIDNVAKTKYELIEALPKNGTAVFNGDNSYCMKLAEKTKLKKYIYSTENIIDFTDVYAKDIKNTNKGLIFKVIFKNGNEIDCTTNLLGCHNVSNILAAICIAKEMGLSNDEIKRGISKIKPVPHRLQLLDTNNGITVIDDAFNSNPEGAAFALDTIKEIEGNKKIVVTPGMVELGSSEYEENKKFGKKIADCCDIAILVGIKRSKPILDGLYECNFNKDNIIVATNLDEATAKLSGIVRSGDVVLFENDLPDNYIE